MKVYQISHDDCGAGWIDKDTESFKYELEEGLKEATLNGTDAGYLETEIDPFLKSLEEAPINTKAKIGAYSFEALEMSKDVFENLPEFQGW
jgi:hypothetical protein